MAREVFETKNLKPSDCAWFRVCHVKWRWQTMGWGIGVRELRWWWEWGSSVYRHAAGEGVWGQTPETERLWLETERLWLGFGCAMSIGNRGQWSVVLG